MSKPPLFMMPLPWFYPIPNFKSHHFFSPARKRRLMSTIVAFVLDDHSPLTQPCLRLVGGSSLLPVNLYMAAATTPQLETDGIFLIK